MGPNRATKLTHLTNLQNCLKSSMITHISNPIGQYISLVKITFTTSTTSYNTNATMDFPIANRSLQIKKLAPWASLKMAHNTWISIRWLFHNKYLVSTKQISIYYKIQNNFLTINHHHVQWVKTEKNYVVFLGFTQWPSSCERSYIELYNDKLWNVVTMSRSSMLLNFNSWVHWEFKSIKNE